MKGLTIRNLIKTCNGTYFGDKGILDQEVTGIFTNSHDVTKGSLFIPIVGARVDAHQFIPDVFEAGALCSLSERKLEEGCHPYIQVKSSLQALKDIAEFYLTRLNVKVVGITGSVGKTSTKEMIFSVLRQRFNALETEGNFNNEIGLPLTVFRLTGEEDVAVLEMGISDFGEMSRLTKIARPDIAVITNIGYCHLANLKSRDGVLKAKTEILEGLKPGGAVILNGDDDKLQTVTASPESHIVFFGQNKDNEIYADNIENLGLMGTKLKIHTPLGEFAAMIPVPGVHMAYNALAACAVGLEFSMSLKDIKQGIETFEPVAGRVNIIFGEKYTIIDDCYNANPVSMKSSIDILTEAQGRKVCILGDMFELGEKEKELHLEVGRYVCEKQIDALITIGNLSRFIEAGAHEFLQENAFSVQNKMQFVHFDTKEEAFSQMELYLQPKDSILVKASNGMKFHEIVNFLQEKQSTNPLK